MNPSEKILIIDDEQALRMNLRAMLEDLGYRILEASCGTEALETCIRERPDLVLLDIRMPGMDGYEVCTRLKADEALGEIPVIFVSGVMEAAEKVKAFRCGAVDYVTKPFNFEEVAARVRAHLALREQKRDLEARNEDLRMSLYETEVLNRKLIDMNEKLRRSEDLKSHFLATMRNEIYNPLSSIMALGAEIEQGLVPPERASSLAGMITCEAFILDFQIRNILCTAELEAGDTCPNITHVDVRSVLRDILDSFGREARKKPVSVSLAEPEGSEEPFLTDADKLRVIASNLVDNAIKFSRDGGAVRIRLRFGDGALVLDVEDDGPGIRAEDRDVIFERFRQLESGVTKQHRGHGLGLALVKALVDMLHGSITVSSDVGRGSTFTCTIPGQPAGEASDTSTFDGNLFFFEDAEEM